MTFVCGYADIGIIVGADVVSEVVETVNAGVCYVKQKPGLDERVEALVADSARRAASDYHV